MRITFSDHKKNTINLLTENKAIVIQRSNNFDTIYCKKVSINVIDNYIRHIRIHHDYDCIGCSEEEYFDVSMYWYKKYLQNL